VAESSEFITGLVDRSIGSGCLTFDVSIGILGKRQFGEMVVWGNGGLGKWWLAIEDCICRHCNCGTDCNFGSRFVRVQERARYAHRTFSLWINVLNGTDYTVSFTNIASA